MLAAEAILKEHTIMVLDRQTINNVWQWPSFQRQPRCNPKVKALAAQIQNTKVIPGELTLGRIKGSDLLYKIDGGHRLLAFEISKADEVYADVTIETFANMEQMADQYRARNSPLRRMKPDDILKAVMEGNPALRDLERRCPFVGFDAIRRSPGGPVVSMSLVLRCWQASKAETPTSNANAIEFGEQLRESEAEEIIHFLQTAHLAWGREPQMRPLWNGMNQTLCMWIWRRVVLHRPPSGSITQLEASAFQKCLEALSRHKEYLEWVYGKSNTSDNFRGPCYTRVVEIFIRALRTEGIVARLPQPAWAAE